MEKKNISEEPMKLEAAISKALLEFYERTETPIEHINIDRVQDVKKVDLDKPSYKMVTGFKLQELCDSAGIQLKP